MNNEEPDRREVDWPPPRDQPDREPTEPWAKYADRPRGEEIVEWKEWQQWR
jgi:hypothetical protein